MKTDIDLAARAGKKRKCREDICVGVSFASFHLPPFDLCDFLLAKKVGGSEKGKEKERTAES